MPPRQLRKGPTGIDVQTLQIARLFHPRRDRWPEHFTLDGVRISGLTEIGRGTIDVLDLNDVRRLELRAEIMKGSHLT